MCVCVSMMMMMMEGKKGKESIIYSFCSFLLRRTPVCFVCVCCVCELCVCVTWLSVLQHLFKNFG